MNKKKLWRIEIYNGEGEGDKKYVYVIAAETEDQAIGNYRHIIVSDEGYWSNQLGWVEDKESATVFKDRNVNLPLGKNCRWETV